MRVRWIGLALVLAAAAAAAGYGLGALDDTAPTAFAPPAPVPASDPALPFEVLQVRPDPIYPALAPGHPLRAQRLGEGPFAVTISAPRGWVRTNSTASEWRWYPADPDDVLNTYFVRLRVVSNTFAQVAASLDSRLGALESAPEVKALTVEQRSEDSFVATYVSEGYRRVTMERFIPDDAGFSYVYLAVIGREQDRAGLADLLARMSASTRLPG